MEQPVLPAQPATRIALVHDFLVTYGGAERVFEEIARLYPEAPIYTLLADRRITERYFQGRDIRASWLSRLPDFLKKRYRFFLPFFPVAVESFDLRDFDVVITSSGAWSKGIVTRLNTKHLAYIHSPMRYAWDYHEEYLKELGARGARKLLTRMLVSYLRLWDRQAALRPDYLMANSRFTADRIQKYYGRESQVVYPGATALREKVPSNAAAERKHFLVVARLTASKKIGAVVAAFNKLGFPLVVVGTGKEKAVLEKAALANVRFVDFISDEDLAKMYRSARALVFPSEEDFGMTAVEALSFGTPVIALDSGGAREIIEAGRSGEFFRSTTPELVADGVRRFLLREGSYGEAAMEERARHFSLQAFRENFENSVRGFLQKEGVWK